MKRYAPNYIYDEVAIQGWQSARTGPAGVKAAGKTLTQANVVAQTNKITSFTANGPTAPVNWVNAHFSAHLPKLQRLHPGARNEVCLGPWARTSGVPLLRPECEEPVPVTPPAGTPGA